MTNPILRADLLMLITAAIWGFAFAAQRLGMDHIGPFLFTGLRFSLGALALLPLLWLRSRRQRRPIVPTSALRGGVLLGLVLSLGINLQQVGLLFTSVTHAGFITGLYVIMVPLLGLLIGQRTPAGTWLGALLAVVGMALLSLDGELRIVSGDWLQLLGAVVWGVHVLLIGALVRHHDPLPLAFLQFATCAVISLVLALALEQPSAQAIVDAAPALLYAGVIAVAVGYTLQMVAQRDALASHAAVILSLEAVFAAAAGALLLDESLTLRGYAGCALMLAGMLAAQLWVRPQERSLASGTR